MNRAIFTQYVRQYLAPQLKPGDIVILDNLSSHKGDEAAALIAERGATLLFLPPYSPDLNPIEMAFAKLKHLLRKARERTRDALWDKIRTEERRVGKECDSTGSSRWSPCHKKKK